MTVELPDDVADDLLKVAARFQKTTQETLIGIIRDFTPSTRADLAHQQTMRREGMQAYLDGKCPKNPESAYLHGYNRGWWDFQLRKLDNLFTRLPEPRNPYDHRPD